MCHSALVGVVAGQLVALDIVDSETLELGAEGDAVGIGARAPYPSEYHPPPFKAKLVLEISLFAFSSPHSGQSLIGSSLIR